MTPPAIVASAELRGLSLNPIASHPVVGHPSYPYLEFREHGMPPRKFEYWVSRGNTNIQVATGVRWGLAVVDLDGDMARDVWSAWTLHRPVPPTPTVATPGGGLHFWFSVPESVVELPSRFLWQACDPRDVAKFPALKHQAVEILADGKLAKCPPSVKLIDGRPVPYRWLPGRSPRECPMAVLPSWLLELPPVASASPNVGVWHRRGESSRHPSVSPGGGGRTHRSVIDLIPDKVALAHQWGLRIVSARANKAGWMHCRAIGREDRTPSTMFSATTGRYVDFVMSENLSLFDLGVALGVYPDFKAAITHLESTYGPGRMS